MLDLRDHATDAHTHRSVDLTLLLAEKLGIPSSKMENIRRGALLHDIGKMGIPDTILLKKGKLTDAEFEIMKTHPEKAFQVLSQIDYLSEALEIPYCHHEKWDGTGYPRQLKDKEIPIAALIFAVVDVYDALTTDRPYRKAWAKQDAIAYIQNQSGKHFCPEVVTAFMEIIHA
jgi:putative nucleotidyltransferase with HDIG domain